ncbi:MAG: division/cell wall cluster transcriptional repressor MraZ [Actinobacteria bacterium]|nr:division/cell wall cluster transcriptional repressor MraZ [Actinomycetota bacterium]MCG2818475.1 division/cell wall cluster transcriptional repressor MraZ [Actinomycetes bacterium]MBU4219429.1 division/cell wall cluster transcriptional repressor MraZ [Actinomycetota bacterium]MBU4358173.1 division/cell wall cluster transcriptional repressor MraZ [Actinomycetota bacterium]MBU4392234.1 division/cell wall cluster transcriptional repressor MraZ [Actinomycetota bacterium]
MLLGYSERTIDAKGRMILPRAFRREFEDGLFITRGLDNCLLLFPVGEWESVVSKIEEMPAGREETRRFSRLFFSNASRLMPDAQGRILIPSHLREMAGLEKDVAVIGLSNKAEVWNPERWAAYRGKSESNYEQAASDIGV